MTTVRVVAIWYLNPDWIAKSGLKLGAFQATNGINMVLAESNLWVGAVDAISLTEFVKDNKISRGIAYPPEAFDDDWQKLIQLCKNGQFPDPIIGTDPFKQVKMEPICACDSLELFRFGCPSARGKTCRSR